MMNRKPKVFLVNQRDFDMSGAKVYGDLVTLYEGQPSDIFSTSKHAYQIKQKLADAQSSDYLVVAGNMVLVVIAFGILYERFGFVNLLLFNIKTSEYTPRVVAKHQLQKGE
jgi:hypothetical protein